MPTTRIEVNEGTHVADRETITVKQAGDLWLDRRRRDGLEPQTLVQYEQHLRLHIVPFIGNQRLNKVTIPLVTSFEDKLYGEGRSKQMVGGVMVSLGAIMQEALIRGYATRNPVRDVRRQRKPGRDGQRHKKQLKIGIDIPTSVEVRAVIDAAVEGKARILIRTAALTGLRASELRGLRWEDVDFDKAELHVNQRADATNLIGSPKSAAGRRTVPLPPGLVKELRKWRLMCPKMGKLGLVFPTENGTPQLLGNILDRQFQPAVVKAGLTVPVKDHLGLDTRDDQGRPIVKPKYPGLHCFRHFYASWCINRKLDGGLELPAKMVQARLGHSSIVITLDTYGHLFPTRDDGSEMAAAEADLLG